MAVALDGWHPIYRGSNEQKSINTNSKYLGYNKKERQNYKFSYENLLYTNHEIKQAFLFHRDFSPLFFFKSNEQSSESPGYRGGFTFAHRRQYMEQLKNGAFIVIMGGKAVLLDSLA